MRFNFIANHVSCFKVKTMCAVLAVSRAGYYAWRRRQPSGRAQANGRLLVEIRQLYQASRGVYGYRKIHRALLAKGLRCSRNRVARLMRQAGLRSRRRRRYLVTTQSRHTRPRGPQPAGTSVSGSRT